MAYYPIMLDIKDKNCLVIGGGKVAYRKIKTLLEYGANVKVIAKKPCSNIKSLNKNGNIKLIERNYEKGDIIGYTLAIAATNDENINKKIAKEAKKHNILVNVADSMRESSFIVPSVFRRGDITISISTMGKSPLLARRLREKLSDLIGVEYQELLNELNKKREVVKKSDIPIEEKIKIYEDIINESGLIK